MRLDAEIWLHGIYHGTYEIHAIWDCCHEFMYALVSIEDEPYVVVQKSVEEGHATRFDVVFALAALDEAIASLRKDYDAEQLGPITLSIDGVGRGLPPACGTCAQCRGRRPRN